MTSPRIPRPIICSTGRVHPRGLLDSSAETAATTARATVYPARATSLSTCAPSGAIGQGNPLMSAAEIRQAHRPLPRQPVELGCLDAGPGSCEV
jgi:hypothetical protein